MDLTDHMCVDYIQFSDLCRKKKKKMVKPLSIDLSFPNFVKQNWGIITTNIRADLENDFDDEKLRVFNDITQEALMKLAKSLPNFINRILSKSNKQIYTFADIISLAFITGINNISIDYRNTFAWCIDQGLHTLYHNILTETKILPKYIDTISKALQIYYLDIINLSIIIFNNTYGSYTGVKDDKLKEINKVREKLSITYNLSYNDNQYYNYDDMVNFEVGVFSIIQQYNTKSIFKNNDKDDICNSFAGCTC